MVRIAGYFYLGVAALACLLNAARGAPLVPLGLGPRLVAGLGIALAAAALTIAFSRLAERRWAWAQRLTEFFRHKLGPLRGREVAALALASGVAEELLFRGALQPAFADMLGGPVPGLIAATLAFGVLHVGGRALWPWTAFALVLGAVLGWLYLYTDSVLPPIVLHVTVNAANLRRIGRPLER
ncbi:MAG: hypothetical protein KatS3mg102_1193 [Planctomycetota bacterium]|nr:MAG: hypothetical protein KatS3mg102_1193 [Planctomycetota bacterium]